jgi:hypothetical protein
VPFGAIWEIKTTLPLVLGFVLMVTSQTSLSAPIIDVNPAALDFGGAFIGYPAQLDLTVSNSRADQLVLTGWSFNNPAYGTNLNVPETIQVASGQQTGVGEEESDPDLT